MAIKLKKASLRAEIKAGPKKAEKTVATEDISLPGMDLLEQGHLHSTVGVSLGYRKSRDWQSVHLDVNVEVPCPIGAEKRGLEYAIYAADKFLESKESAVNEYLRSLA